MNKFEYSIEIPDEMIVNCILGKIAGEVGNKYCYPSREERKLIDKAILAIVKEREDEIVDRAVTLAAEKIARRGIKKMLEEIEDE